MIVIEIIVRPYQETMSLGTHSNSKPPTVVEMVYQRTNQLTDRYNGIAFCELHYISVAKKGSLDQKRRTIIIN